MGETGPEKSDPKGHVSPEGIIANWERFVEEIVGEQRWKTGYNAVSGTQGIYTACVGRGAWRIIGHPPESQQDTAVRKRFYWAHCREKVEKWCKKCTVCSATKGPTTRTNGKMNQYNVRSSLERIAIVVAGPFPMTTNNKKYILVATNYFSKLPEAYTISNYWGFHSCTSSSQ